MAYSQHVRLEKKEKLPSMERRVFWIGLFFLLCALVIVGRFFQLQILEYRTYKVLASDQHEIQAALIPKRGTVFLRDRVDGMLHPIAKDRDAWIVYAVPKEIKHPEESAKKAAPILNLPESELTVRFSVPTSSYTILAKDVSFDIVEQLRAQPIQGIGVSKGLARLYPEAGIGGQFIGFVNYDEHNQRVGRYGVEGFEQDLLAGQAGTVLAEKDGAGRRLAMNEIQLKEARDGSDVILTVDRTIQYTVCQKIQEAVRQYDADSGSVIVMDPETGGIVAMCSTPDFDPTTYGKIENIGVLNNPATFYQFEPGSIFKAMTLSAGLDTGKITPNTTYNDTGEETMDDFTIRNSDKKAHGIQTMTEVLEKSLNTGTIFVERLMGKEVFRDYLVKFGFGVKTGVELNSEAKGDISGLTKKGKIFGATASFGQGISVTPIQILSAYAALANGGKLMKVHIVDEVIHPDGERVVTKPKVINQVVSERTSQLISAMLVNVVENGHGKRAAVPGYYVAGKTGTAQVPNPHGQGYLQGVTIGSFAGYAPVDHPKFVMLVKLDNPKTVEYAEASAAPVFGEIAKFLLTYYQVPPERPIAEEKGKPLPVLP